MKTSADMLDRMEALVRKLAKHWETADPSNIQDDIDEAARIVSELPEPVDPLVAQAQRYYDDWVADPSDMPFAVDAMAYALRRAREEGVR